MGFDHMVHPSETYTEPVTLVDLLRRRAAGEPDSALFRFLPDGEDGVEATLTPGELDLRARALATRLQELGLTGGRALLLYPPGLEFIAAFFGCLYAGVVAVAAHLPRLNRPMTRLGSIVADCGPSVVLTCSSLAKDAAHWEAGMTELRGVHRIFTDERLGELDEQAGRWSDPGARRDTLALLQYTSGSTTAPRGVMITHGNLLHNSSLIHDAFGSVPEARGVFWLPTFHDMGLIGGVIQTLYCGGFEHALLAGLVHPASDPMAAGHFAHGGDHQRRAEFRLRALRREDDAQAAGRAGPELVACGVQWRRAGPRGDTGPLRRSL